MIINVSRAKSFQACRQLAYNWDELRLKSHREADPLIIGEAYHLGSEVITKSADVNEAVKQAEARIRERMEGQLILPEERPNIERNIEFVKHAIVAFGEQYDKADFRVLWPEVNGCVPLPNTEHHCFFCHRLIFPSIPFESCYGHNNSDENGLPKCYQPHYLKFRTDGIIEMYKRIWLLEQKTTSSTGRNNFWKKFNLDLQVRAYCYGVWKSTGMLVSGVLVNAIIKHSKQVTLNGEKKYQIDPTNVGFEREPIIVTQKDMEDTERELILIATDYEKAFANPTQGIYKNTNNCMAYNRVCEYWDRCLRFQENREGEFRLREMDYVEKQYYELMGLPAPEDTTTEETIPVEES
jgi:hypothetical protein